MYLTLCYDVGLWRTIYYLSFCSPGCFLWQETSSLHAWKWKLNHVLCGWELLANQRMHGQNLLMLQVIIYVARVKPSTVITILLWKDLCLPALESRIHQIQSHRATNFAWKITGQFFSRNIWFKWWRKGEIFLNQPIVGWQPRRRMKKKLVKKKIVNVVTVTTLVITKVYSKSNNVIYLWLTASHIIFILFVFNYFYWAVLLAVIKSEHFHKSFLYVIVLWLQCHFFNSCILFLIDIS